MNRFPALSLLSTGLLLCGLSTSLRGDEQKPKISFAKEVMPFLAEKCVTCHSGAKAIHKLSLDTPAGILKGGDQGPALVKGKSAESLMVMYMAAQRLPKMPPNEQLDESYLTMIRRWIDEGANMDLPKKDGKK